MSSGDDVKYFDIVNYFDAGIERDCFWLFFVRCEEYLIKDKNIILAIVIYCNFY